MKTEPEYVTVVYRGGLPPAGRRTQVETVYDQVKTERQTVQARVSARVPAGLVSSRTDGDPDPVFSDTEDKRPSKRPMAAVVTACVLLCSLLMMSSLVAFILHLRNENQQLLTEKSSLQRRTEELNREKNRLNWTLGVIMTHESFPVLRHCPHKVCRPCLDGWFWFWSSCYSFSDDRFSRDWKTWQESRDYCRLLKAELVVIDSLEEQTFVNNHTETYNDEKHGYWMALSSNSSDGWTWTDQTNATLTFWRRGRRGYRVSCALTHRVSAGLEFWSKASCTMKNRWICESPALIRQDGPETG